MQLNIAENIRRLRKARSLTQEQLAEALGVTVGAVYKWESGRATPDISLIVEMAAFFEISVDVLLGYELHRSSAQEAADGIRRMRKEKRVEEGKSLARTALQKYPNSFSVVHESALIYYVSLKDEDAEQAIRLFEHACDLLDQNTDEHIGLVSIQNDIAACYLILGQKEKALELLRRNNAGMMNSSTIGMILSMHCTQPNEALTELSDGLGRCMTELYRTVVGFQNAYTLTKQYDLGLAISLWLHQTLTGLCRPGEVCYLHKGDALSLAVCAVFALRLNDREGAYGYLREARRIALSFDAAPDYSMNAIRFYHGKKDVTAYDDIGETAMDAINRFISSMPDRVEEIWEEVCNEKE